MKCRKCKQTVAGKKHPTHLCKRCRGEKGKS